MEEIRTEEAVDNLLFRFYPPNGMKSFVNLLSPYFSKSMTDPLSKLGNILETLILQILLWKVYFIK